MQGSERNDIHLKKRHRNEIRKEFKTSPRTSTDKNAKIHKIYSFKKQKLAGFHVSVLKITILLKLYMYLTLILASQRPSPQYSGFLQLKK